MGRCMLYEHIKLEDIKHKLKINLKQTCNQSHKFYQGQESYNFFVTFGYNYLTHTYLPIVTIISICTYQAWCFGLQQRHTHMQKCLFWLKS